MIGLAVYLNGKRLTVAGTEDLGVLNVIVNRVGQLGLWTPSIEPIAYAAATGEQLCDHRRGSASRPGGWSIG